MKTLALIIITLLISTTTALAGPWLACDPYPPAGVQPQYFYLTLDGGTPIKCTHTVGTTYWIIYDLAAIPIGNHTSTLKACINQPPWGEVCSAAAPFDFTRPQGPTVPTGITLSQ